MLHPTVLSYAAPYSTELYCILLSYPAFSELCSTPLSYDASFWATLAAHFEIRCIILNWAAMHHVLTYATSTELRCTLLYNAAPCWATLHPLSELPILQFFNRIRKMLMPELDRYQREFSGTELRLEMLECPPMPRHRPWCPCPAMLIMGSLQLWRRHIRHNQTVRQAVEYCTIYLNPVRG